MALSKILPASQAQYAGARNLIINGACTISQRGTSQTGITSGGYKQAPDRFHLNVVSAGTWTASQSTTAPEGFSNSYKVECTVADASLAASDVIRLRQRIEGQNLQQLKKGTSNAESVTLSFYVRSSKTGTYIVELTDKDNSRHIAKSYSITTADTWQYVSVTYDGDTTGSLDNDNAESLTVQFYLVAGSDFQSGTLDTAWASQITANRAVGQVNLADTVGNDWYITGIQLEVGEQATPFEHRSYGDEFARCQRYYEQGIITGVVSASNTGYMMGRQSPLVEKRGSPTITVGNWSINNQTSGTQTNTAAWQTSPYLNIVCTHYPGVNYYGASANGFAKYTADSEL